MRVGVGIGPTGSVGRQVNFLVGAHGDIPKSAKAIVQISQIRQDRIAVGTQGKGPQLLVFEDGEQYFVMEFRKIGVLVKNHVRGSNGRGIGHQRLHHGIGLTKRIFARGIAKPFHRWPTVIPSFAQPLDFVIGAGTVLGQEDGIVGHS